MNMNSQRKVRYAKGMIEILMNERLIVAIIFFTVIAYNLKQTHKNKQ